MQIGYEFLVNFLFTFNWVLSGNLFRILGVGTVSRFILGSLCEKWKRSVD